MSIKIEFYVILGNGLMFGGFKKGDVYWTHLTNEAKPMYNLDNFNFFERYYDHLKPYIFKL